MVCLGASMWGGSGVAGQYLLQDCGFSTAWLVVSRMLLAGCLFLLIDYSCYRQNILSIWKDKQDRHDVLLFSIFGMLAVQYTYFACIQQGNAAAATILQYLMPVIIIGYTALSTRKIPPRREFPCVAMAVGHPWASRYAVDSACRTALGAWLRFCRRLLHHPAQTPHPQMAGHTDHRLGHAAGRACADAPLSPLAVFWHLEQSGSHHLRLHHPLWYHHCLRLLPRQHQIHLPHRNQSPRLHRAPICHHPLHGALPRWIISAQPSSWAPSSCWRKNKNLPWLTGSDMSK